MLELSQDTVRRWAREGIVPLRDGRWTPAAVAQARVEAESYTAQHGWTEGGASFVEPTVEGWPHAPWWEAGEGRVVTDPARPNYRSVHDPCDVLLSACVAGFGRRTGTAAMATTASTTGPWAVGPDGPRLMDPA